MVALPQTFAQAYAFNRLRVVEPEQSAPAQKSILAQWQKVDGKLTCQWNVNRN